MSKKIVAIISFISLIGFIILTPKKIVAASPRFEVTTDVTYQISDTGQALVTQNFYLTNLTSQFAPDEYVTKPGVSGITNFRAFNQNGLLPVEVTGSDPDKELHIKLPRDTVGVGKTFSWILSYQSSAIVKKTGRLWEISVPKPAEVEGLQSFHLNIFVPKSFGKEVILDPKPATGGRIWTNADLKGPAITAVYDPSGLEASYQAFEFKLSYNLYNPKLYPVRLEINLPPDTAYQKIFLDDISPRPINVTIDSDGNWKAVYQLGPASRLKVNAAGRAAVYSAANFRPIGIVSFPAAATREVAGLTAAGTLDHRSEIYDPKSAVWIAGPENPAGFDHLTLAINSPKYFKPEFSLIPVENDLDTVQRPKVGLRVDVPREIVAGFPASATIFVENYGPTSFAGDVVELNGRTLKMQANSLAANPMPPFSSQAVRFKILSAPWDTTGSDIIKLNFAQEEREYRTNIKPFFKNNFLLTVVILFSLGIISIIAQIARSLLFQGPDGKDHLRR